MKSNIYVPNQSYASLIAALQKASLTALNSERTLSELLNEALATHNIVPEEYRDDYQSSNDTPVSLAA